MIAVSYVGPELAECPASQGTIEFISKDVPQEYNCQCRAMATLSRFTRQLWVPQEVLNPRSLAHRIRDEEMPELGYRLEDRPGAPAAWKPDDPTVLKREAAERQAIKLAALRKKAQQTLKLKLTVLCPRPCLQRATLPAILKI